MYLDVFQELSNINVLWSILYQPLSAQLVDSTRQIFDELVYSSRVPKICLSLQLEIIMWSCWTNNHHNHRFDFDHHWVALTTPNLTILSKPLFLDTPKSEVRFFFCSDKSALSTSSLSRHYPASSINSRCWLEICSFLWPTLSMPLSIKVIYQALCQR